MRITGRMITVAEPAWAAMPSRVAGRAAGNVTTMPMGASCPSSRRAHAANTVRHGAHYGRGLVNGPLTDGYARMRPAEVSRVWLFGRSRGARARGSTNEIVDEVPAGAVLGLDDPHVGIEPRLAAE